MIGVSTGLLVVVVACLGADWPPPPGFVALVVAAAVLAVLISVALPRWRARGSRSLAGPAAQGAAVVVAMWWGAALLPFTGEPTVSPSLWDHLIGAGLAAGVGAIGGAVLARIA